MNATASVLLDWILAYERNGWLDGARSRNDQQPLRLSEQQLTEDARRFALYRHKEGLLNTGERYPGHGRERPLIKPRPAPTTTATEDDITATINAVERTREERERRAQNQRESAPYRPRGHNAPQPSSQEDDLAANASSHSPPDDDGLPF